MKLEKPNIDMKQEMRILQRFADAVPQRLRHPIRSVDDAKRVAANIARRTDALALQNARLGGMHWAASFATAQELTLLEQVAAAQHHDVSGTVQWFAESYEEELRRECEHAVTPEPHHLFAVVRLVVLHVADGKAEMASAFAGGALEVWAVVKSAVPKETAKATDTSAVS